MHRDHKEGRLNYCFSKLKKRLCNFNLIDYKNHLLWVVLVKNLRTDSNKINVILPSYFNNKHQNLSNHVKFFIDTANLSQIKEAEDLGVLDGVTTNPSLMAKEGIAGHDNILKH